MATRGRARRLRRDATDAERAIWRGLKTKQLSGWKFRRQHPIGPYFADFACPAAKLIVELGGGQHAVRVAQDARRTAHLERGGWRVIRFWNTDVLTNLEGVLETILNALPDQPLPPAPSPSAMERG